MFRQICNCCAGESRSKLYLVMPSAADNCKSAGIEYKNFNPPTSYFFINRYEFRIKDPYTLCSRIAYPTEQ